MTTDSVNVRRFIRAGSGAIRATAGSAALLLATTLTAGCSGGGDPAGNTGAALATISTTASASSSATGPTAPGGTTTPAPSGSTKPTTPVSPSHPASASAAKPTPAAPPPPNGKQPALPPPGAKFDYQIGAAYPPPAGVRVVSRDSSAQPAAGLYSICYLNAFQAQPDAVSWWQTNHPDLLLHGKDGALVVDQGWNEPLLDVSTAAKRAALAQIQDGWIDGCARKGFQAVEPDNLDSYSRSNGLLTMAENTEFATLLAGHAHAVGLAIAQKNATELLSRHQAIGFDFAVAEECGQYDECGQYAAAYADRVVDIEYGAAGFGAACKAWGSRLSVVQRDRDVTAPGSGSYVFKNC